MSLPFETELPGIHTTRRKPGWIYKANFFFLVGEGYLHIGTKYVLFPTFKMKEYMLLVHKYFGNMSQKSKMNREVPPFKGGKKKIPTYYSHGCKKPSIGFTTSFCLLSSLTFI